ncbi:protein MKS1-like [Salvia miltiorrhiza]|uniref:protein MKS1-like n=1 Tax=Salvia miltiorrhiza TaxID=226208 RepID=UPI0025AC743E|nr:protein MKS1-like [Salvia miltiorrhiza]
MSDAPLRHFPRQELHLGGPRPPPLSLSKQSRKISKQKAAPPPPPAAAAEPKSHRRHPPPPPVIIYTVSPKKIHVDPSEFMTIVQRLTGNTPPPPSSSALRENGGGVFPAAQPVSNTQFSDGCVETSQNLLWNATDNTHLMNTGLHGNINQNNLLENNLMMNMPSSSGFDAFNYLFDI